MRKPPDKIERENKTEYKSFPIPLKSIVNAPWMIDSIEQIVLKIHDLMTHSYQFIRMITLYQLEHGIPLDIYNKKFIIFSIKTLCNCGNPRNENPLWERLKAFYNNEYFPNTNHVKTDSFLLSKFINNLEVEIRTAISNNIQERFIPHFKRFINVILENEKMSKAKLGKFKYNFLSGQFKTLEEQEIYLKFFYHHSLSIFPSDMKDSFFLDVKKRTLLYLKGMLYMNSVLEQKGRKLFQPLPLRTELTPRHILIDTTSLVTCFDWISQSMIRSRIVRNKTEIVDGKIDFYKHDIWSVLLKFNPCHKIFKSRDYFFDYSIRTDGVTCCLLFRRKDRFGLKDDLPVTEKIFPTIESFSDEDLRDIEENYKVIGCDPGKRNLVYMTDKRNALPNSGKTLKYTVQQRKFESRAYRNEVIMKKLKREVKSKENFQYSIKEVEAFLSKFNSKTSNYDTFKLYVQAKSDTNQYLKEFYQNIKFRKMRLRNFIYGKKSVDSFIAKIGKTFQPNKEDKPIFIGYGNWSERSGFKNSAPSLGKGLRKLIARKYQTALVCEAYTSKRCCVCTDFLNHYAYKTKATKKKKSRWKKSHRLLTCKTCGEMTAESMGFMSSENKNIEFRNRDVNGAVNILKNTLSYLQNRHYMVGFGYSVP